MVQRRKGADIEIVNVANSKMKSCFYVNIGSKSYFEIHIENSCKWSMKTSHFN